MEHLQGKTAQSDSMRERERDRETERQRDRETERQRDREEERGRKRDLIEKAKLRAVQVLSLCV